jgi:hypothetical protein
MAEEVTTTSPKDQVYRVVESFSFDHGGRTYAMKRNDMVTRDHPGYKGRENLFEPVTEEYVRAQAARTSVGATWRANETATAAPGERRTVTTAAAGTKRGGKA